MKHKNRAPSVEKHSSPNAEEDIGDVSARPHGATDTVELHETILAAPMTEASPLADFGGQPQTLHETETGDETSERSESLEGNEQRPTRATLTDKKPG